MRFKKVRGPHKGIKNKKKNNNHHQWHLLTTCSILSSLHVLTHLISTTALGDGYYCYDFIIEESGTQQE